MNYKNFIITLLFFTLLLSFPSKAIVIKLGSLAPQGSPWDKGLQKLAYEWEKISQGEVILKVYSGGVAGDEADMIRKMRINQLNAAGMTGVGLSRIFPEIITIQLPLFVQNNEELNYVLSKMKPTFDKELEKRGFKVIIWSFVGWVHFFSKKPVIMPEDLKAQKFFIWGGDPDAVMLWKESGFHVVPLTPSDIMPSLQSGMIEAFSATPLSAASYQWFGIAKNMCGMKWAPLIGGIVVNTSIWNKLDPTLATKLEAVAQQIGEEMQKEILKADEEALNIMKKYGLSVTNVPLSAKEAWIKLVNSNLETKYLKNINKDLFEEVKRHLNEYRKLNK
jgi:TRAP-type C4-dicarboxylate transport system substrate-binding protein